MNMMSDTALQSHTLYLNGAIFIAGDEMNRKVLAAVIVAIVLVAGYASAAVILTMPGDKKDDSLGEVYGGYFMDLKDANSLVLIEAQDDVMSSAPASSEHLSLKRDSSITGSEETTNVLYKTLDGIHFEKVKLKKNSSEANGNIEPEWNIIEMKVSGGFIFITVKAPHDSSDNRQEMYDRYGFCWDLFLYYLVSLDTGEVYCINQLMSACHLNDEGKVAAVEFGYMKVYHAVGKKIYYTVTLQGIGYLDKDSPTYNDTISGAYELIVEESTLTTTKLVKASTGVKITNMYRNGIVSYSMGDNQYLWLSESMRAMDFDPSVYSEFNGHLVKNLVMGAYTPVSYDLLNADGSYTSVIWNNEHIRTYNDDQSSNALISKTTKDGSTTWVYLERSHEWTIDAVRVTLNGDGTIAKDVVNIDCSNPGYLTDKMDIVKLESSGVFYDSSVTEIQGTLIAQTKIAGCYVCGQSVLWIKGASVKYLDTENWTVGVLTAPDILQFTNLTMKNGKIIVEGKSTSMADVRGEVKPDLTLDLTYTEPEYTIITLLPLN